MSPCSELASEIASSETLPSSSLAVPVVGAGVVVVVVFVSLVARVAMRFAVAAVVVFRGVVDFVIWFFWVVELSRWRLALEAMMDSVARKLGLRWRLAPARVVVIPDFLACCWCKISRWWRRSRSER